MVVVVATVMYMRQRRRMGAQGKCSPDVVVGGSELLILTQTLAPQGASVVPPPIKVLR